MGKEYVKKNHFLEFRKIDIFIFLMGLNDLTRNYLGGD